MWLEEQVGIEPQRMVLLSVWAGSGPTALSRRTFPQSKWPKPAVFCAHLDTGDKNSATSARRAESRATPNRANEDGC
jgi:hypothetical protein